MKFTLFLITVILSLVVPGLCFRNQRVKVKGKLMCGNNPASDVKVELYDEDTGMDPDDLLEAGYTDSQGKFMLQGSTKELTNIDPEIRIYHDCNDGIIPCQRRFTFGVPDKYINKGVFNFGTFNLEMQIPHDEEHDCIH